jgi:TP901 family phage tail tape measure protein
LKHASESLGGVGTVAAGVTKAVAGMAVAVGSVAAVGSSVHKAMDFEHEIDAVAALGHEFTKGTQGYEDLTNKALELGATTKFSALEAAQGLEALVKAGMPAETIMKDGAQAALDLAAAAGLGLQEAAEVMSTSVNAFSKEGLGATEAANILAATADTAATDVHELKYALSSVSAVAASAGLKFKDTNAALGVMANKGLKGSDAGTSLKTMLNRLQPTTRETRELFLELGLMTEDGGNRFYTAAGKMKSMDQIAGILQESMAGLTDQQRQLTMSTLFGSDAVRGATIIADGGAAAIQDFEEKMDGLKAADVAAKKMDNATGAIELFKSAMETLQITVMRPLLPLIKSVVIAATNVVSSMAAWFTSPQAKAWGASVSSAINLVKSAFSGIMTIVNGNLSGGVDSLLKSFNYKQVGIFIKIADVFKVAISTANMFKKALGGVFQLFKGDKEGGVDILLKAGLNYKQVGMVLKITDGIKTALSDVVNFIVNRFVPIIGTQFAQFGNFIGQLWTAIQPLFPPIWAAIMSVYDKIADLATQLDPIREEIYNFVMIIVNAFMDNWPTIVSIVSGVWAGLQPVFGFIMSAIGLIVAIAKEVGKVFAYIWPDILAIVNKVAPPLAEMVGHISSVIGWLINNVVKPMIPVMGTVFKGMWDILRPILDAIVGAIMAVINTINWLANAWETVKGVAGKVASFFGLGGGGEASLKVEASSGPDINKPTAGQPAPVGPSLPNSHAAGLSNVPYDGYLARLHKGERVLTATENSKGQGGGSFSFGDIHIHGSSGNPEEFADKLMSIIAQRVSDAGGQM